MSVAAYELGRFDSSEESERPELFDVNKVLIDALALQAGEQITEIEAFNIRVVEQRGRASVFGRGALVVDFRIRDADGRTLPTKRLEIDDENRPLPETLIASFGALALEEPTRERIYTS